MLLAQTVAVTLWGVLVMLLARGEYSPRGKGLFANQPLVSPTPPHSMYGDVSDMGGWWVHGAVSHTINIRAPQYCSSRT